MRAEVAVDRELRGYLETLVARLAGVTEIEAVYLVGSGALGDWQPGASDVDVVAVTSRSLNLEERRAVVEAAESVPSPARKLELVVYPRGGDAWELNLNTGEHVSYDPAAEPAFCCSCGSSFAAASTCACCARRSFGTARFLGTSCAPRSGASAR